METPKLTEFLLMNAMPMLIPRDTPIRRIVSIHIANLWHLFLVRGKPTHYHFIYSGWGARRTFTPSIGNGYFLLHRFQKLRIEAGRYIFAISLIPWEYFMVTKMTLSSARPTFLSSSFWKDCSQKF